MKEKLRRMRKERDMKQADVAEDIGISRGTYASYENGVTPPTHVVASIAKYYDVTTDYLLGLSTERKPASGALGDRFQSLEKHAGEHALTATEIASLLDAALRYYRKGAPAQHVPMDILRGYLQGMTGAIRALSDDDVPALLDSLNAAELSALDSNKMLIQYFETRRSEP